MIPSRLRWLETFAFGFMFLLHPLDSQESAPAEIGALRATMLELQKGSWSLDAARGVIETLISNQHEAAAIWWVTLADEAVKDKKLPANAQATLSAFRKRAELEGASADDRKLALKLVRHLESVVASKNFEEAKTVVAMARLLTALVPDAPTARAFEAAEKKVQAGANQDPSNLAKQQKQFAEMQDAAAGIIKARVERLLAQFRAAGCRPGRAFLAKVITGAVPVVGDQQVRTWSVALKKAAREVEPARVLSVLARPLGEIRLFRDGDDLGSMERAAVELKVIGGDTIQFKVPQYSAEADKKAFHVAAVSARLDGKDIEGKHWFVNKAVDPTVLDPPLGPNAVIRVSANDSRLKSIDVKLKPDQGGFLGADGDRVVGVGLNEACVEIEKEFEDLKLKIRWVGAFGGECVVVLKVPDG